jgi:hypothetical protein
MLQKLKFPNKLRYEAPVRMLSKLDEEYGKLNMLSDTDFPLCVQLMHLVQEQKPKTERKIPTLKKYADTLLKLQEFL